MWFHFTAACQTSRKQTLFAVSIVLSMCCWEKVLDSGSMDGGREESVCNREQVMGSCKHSALLMLRLMPLCSVHSIDKAGSTWPTPLAQPSPGMNLQSLAQQILTTNVMGLSCCWEQEGGRAAFWFLQLCCWFLLFPTFFGCLQKYLCLPSKLKSRLCFASVELVWK